MGPSTEGGGSGENMQAFLILLPLVIIVVTVFLGLTQTLFRTWLDYRAKMAYLDKLEKDPDKLEYAAEVQALIAEGGKTAVPRQDYALTGLVLGGIGVACLLLGLKLRVGQLAVGFCVGGVGCIVLGVAISLVGMLIRALKKDPIAELRN